ncbi:hypothetical protein Micbo1qcDRAFT_164543 [Microdochium bolleyi]|uniref:DUF1993 domain-containing protein n=1 Tax=Microdochium bolleyi TaxID=196109 RepID=A0A136IYP3_9PEZI|nr:hypothetical protein Micbo1qcDRAFT_164543 [Microdochium bolleyi]
MATSSTPAVTFHDLAYLPLLRTVKTAIHITTKAQQHVAAHPDGISEADLVTARLVDDMYPFHEQLFQLRKNVSQTLARLRDGGRSPAVDPVRAENVTTFAQCLAYLHDAIGELTAAAGADSSAAGSLFADSQAAATIKVEYGPLAVEVTGKQLVEGMMLPNAYFHLTTAYGILRSRGVPVGKADYMGAFFSDFVDMEKVKAASAQLAAAKAKGQ